MSFKGVLVLDEFQNLSSLGQSEILQKVPEIAFLLPFLSDLSTVDFSGNLPLEGEKRTQWRLDIKDRDGKAYGAGIGVDPKVSPWTFSVALSTVDFSLPEIVPFLPETLRPREIAGTGKILEASGTGPWGKWKEWKSDVRASLQIDRFLHAVENRRVSDLRVILDGQGTGPRLGGTLSVTADSFQSSNLENPVLGLKARDLSFSFSFSDFSWSLSGPWSVQEALGSSYSGLATLSPIEGYRFTGETKKLSFQPFPFELEGDWRGSFTVVGKALEDPSPRFDLRMEGDRFQYGELDLSSRKVTIEAIGTKQPAGSPQTLDRLSIAWGQALGVTLKNGLWRKDAFEAREASLTGDLAVLAQFVPGFKIAPQYGKWVHPRDWVIRGGIRVRTDPALEIEVDRGELDSGRGVKGPLGFQYRGQTSSWSLSTPTLNIQLADLVRELGLPWLDLKGAASLSAEVEGGAPGNPLRVRSALVRGELKSSDGRVSRVSDDGRIEDSYFGWEKGSGRINLDWSSESKRLETILDFDDWIWFTKPVAAPNQYPRFLRSGPTHIEISGTRVGENAYQVNSARIAFGKTNPITGSAHGRLINSNGVWIPDLNVSLFAERAPATAVFRGIQIGGSGEFRGKVAGNRSGAWSLDGAFSMDGMAFRHVVSPVVFQNLRGSLYVKDFFVDEYLSYDRWRKRSHPPLKDLRPGVLEAAFSKYRNEPAQIVADRMRIGDAEYQRVAFRAIRNGEVLYINTGTGEFTQGNYPFALTGYLYFHPRDGVASRLTGKTTRNVPLAVAVPVINQDIGFDYDAIDVTFYMSRDFGKPMIETRYITLGIPVGRLKDIPGLGPYLFGWTPDSLEGRSIVVQRVGQNPWKVLNPLKLSDAVGIPDYWLREVPLNILKGARDQGTDFFEGLREGVQDFFIGDE